jgi:uncharacterized protein YecT (DUF1311 family)
VDTARRKRAVAEYTTVIVLIALVLAGCSSEASKPTARPVRATLPENRCDGDTPEIGACLGRVYSELDRERARLEGRVVAAAVQYEVSDPSTYLPNLKAEWRVSATAFAAYREKACDAVNLARMPGTWAGIEAISCLIRLTRERMALLRIALEGKGGY